MIRWVSRSAEETKKIGRELGKLLRAGDVVALVGELGSGKTTLVKGMAQGLEVPSGGEKVLSPSFVLVHEYQGREKLYHLDWYRLSSVRGVDAGLSEECFDSEAVTVVEWADRGKEILPPERLEIRLEHHGEESRMLRITAKGGRYEELLSHLPCHSRNL